MNEFHLISSNKSFKAFRPNNKYNVSISELLNNSKKYPKLLEELGFLVIKNVLSNSTLETLRYNYYSLFDEEYKYSWNNWVQKKESQYKHGCGNHPSKKYIQSDYFLRFINKKIFKKIASIILNSKKTILSKRVILRSFSKLSKVNTFAHRDKEYYVNSDPSKAFTIWIPIGKSNSTYGQLIYLENSHKFEFDDKSFKPNKEKIISKDLFELANQTSSRWLIPKINKGDILIHSLNCVHASFESSTLSPRLSCDLRFAASKVYLDPRWDSFWKGDDGL